MPSSRVDMRCAARYNYIMSEPSMPSYTANAQTSQTASAPQESGAPSPVQAGPRPDVASGVTTGLRPIVAYVSSESDPYSLGTRVVEPHADTRQAVRGSLYAVVELSADEGAIDVPADVTERMLSLLQRTYYTARGSQANVLGEAVRSALGVVSDHNAHNANAPLRVSLCCATLVNQRLMLLCCGAAFAMLRSGERIELYPNQPDKASPVNPDEPPALDVLKWEMTPTDVALLCGPGWSERLPIKTLAATVYYVTSDTAEDAAEGLREQAGGSAAPGLLLVMQPAAPPAPPRPATPLTAPRRSAPAGLPTSLSAAPPVTAPADVSSQEVTTTGSYIPPELDAAAAANIPAFLRRSDMAAGLSLEPPDAPATATPASHFEPFPTLAVQAAAAGALDTNADEAMQASDDSDAHDAGPSAADRIVLGAKESADRARSFFRQMLPEKRALNPADFELLDDEAIAADAAEPNANANAAAEAQAAALPPRNRAAAGVAAPALMPAPPLPAFDAIEQPPFAPPAPASGSRARLFITLALVVALLVPVTVAAYYLTTGENSRQEAEMLVSLAQAKLGSAQDELNNGNMRSALDLASESQGFIERAVELVGPTEASNELGGLVRRIQQESSEYQAALRPGVAADRLPRRRIPHPAARSRSGHLYS